jgi:nicotinate-nucleotide pyrophosphorylase (carboxylating)
LHTLSDIERQRVRIALVEDLGKGDVTSLATVAEDAQGRGEFIVKADGILAGLDIAREAFLLHEVQNGITSPTFEFKEIACDGASVKKGETIATVRAAMRTLLAVERVALNLLQRMSGIATMTHTFVEAVRGTGAVILDTRKTAPLLRPFDRTAVRMGGGTNHRSSLSAMVLVKDNHIAANRGDVRAVIEHLREYFADPTHERVPIEIEVTSLEQFGVILEHGKGFVNRVMFDNFDLDLMRKAVQMNGGTFETEASGGITLATVRAVAETGVNFISVGALTHSVMGLDISFEVQGERITDER